MRLRTTRRAAARALAGLLTLGSVALVAADVSTDLSLASQLPQLGEVGQPYSWTISQNTFTSDKAGASLQYSIDGLPPWCKFDPAQRSFTGTPQTSDVGKTWITVTAADGGQSDSDGFMLNVVSQPAVKLVQPLAAQLPVASTLGPSNILPNGALHIPLGWSFSVGFAGDTFASPDGSTIYVSARLGDGSMIPSWLKFDPTTTTFWGVAPTQPGKEGATFDVVVSASSVMGYSGTTSTFTIVVSQHALTLGGPLRPVNASIGDSFRYTIPTTGLKLDGRTSPASNPINVSVDLSQLPWLTFDAANHSISGVPPEDLISSNSTDVTTVQVPVTFHDTFNNSLPAPLSINVYPSIFSSSTLPSIFVTPGQPFNQSLASLVRMPRNSSAPIVTAEFDPAQASTWLSFNSTTYVLAGRAPINPADDRVKVYLTANSNSTNGISYHANAAFSVAVAGDAGETSTNNNNANTGGKGGLTQQGKLALGASLGTAGGLVLLVILMMCCRRCMAVEEHDTQGNVKDFGDDDATLASNTKSPKFGKAYLQPNYDEKHLGTPSTLVASPNTDHTAIKFGEAGNAYEDAVRHYHDAQAINRSGAADNKPTKHVFFKSILKGSKPKSDMSISRPHFDEEAHSPSGLGLSLDGPNSDQPYRSSPERSQRTIGSRKASWETDIFNESPGRSSQGGGGTPRSVASKEETPVRRGAPARRLLEGAVRQRGGHVKDSPAFTTTQRFEGQPPLNENDLDESDLADAVIQPVSHVSLRSVQAHQPALTSSGRNVSQKIQIDDNDNDGAFEDAVDGDPSELREFEQKPATQPNRMSTLSYQTDHNGPGAVDGGIIFDHSGLKSPAAGSTFGAASFISSQMNPEDTMRIVEGGPPPTPQTGSTSTARPSRASSTRSPSRPSSRASGSEDPVQPGLGHPGKMLRVKLKLRQPVPLQGGAPGSPGKRSGRKTVHMPLLDDPSSTDHLSLPDWLSWLSWDPRICELSGMVPDNLTTACQIPLVLMARSSDAGPVSPSRRPASSHSRKDSSESTKTLSGSEDEVVARILLELRPRDWVMPIRY